MDSITLTAPDISCDHCKRAVEGEISTLAGVQSVSVDVPSKQITVTYDPAELTPGAIADRLDEAGYPVAS